MSLFIGVDVGGTKVLAAAVTSTGRITRTARRSTPDRQSDPVVVEQALTEAVREVAGGKQIDGVGIAAAGFVDAAGERIMFAPHLPYRGEEVRARLMERWGCPVVLDNDANCTARAEVTHGAARGAEDARRGHARHRHRRGGRPRRTGPPRPQRDGGRVRAHAGGARAARAASAVATAAGSSTPAATPSPGSPGRASVWRPRILEGLCGGDPDVLKGPMVTTAAEAGDRVALEAFASVGDWLGVGVANLVAAFDPEVVVIGGGVSAAGDLLLEPARVALGRSLVGAGHRVVPPMLRATLGPEAGAVGGSLLIRTMVKGTARRSRASRIGGTTARAQRRAARGTARRR